MEIKGIKLSKTTIIAIAISIALLGAATLTLNNPNNQTTPTPTDTNQGLENRSNSSSNDQLADNNDDTTTDSASNSGDVVHTGEEGLEEFIGSRSDYLNGYPDYHWIELEDPGSQVEQPIESEWFAGNDQFTYFVEEGSFVPAEVEEYEIDTMYITIPEPGAEANPEYTPEVYVLNEDLWDEDADFIDNIRESTHGVVDSSELGEDDLEVLFSEDIKAYNDVSDNFPQEYLDSIEQ